jgi:hypothetical protein
MRTASFIAVLGLALSAPAVGGPPFLTDDPEPTDTGDWEIYAPLLDAAGRGADYSGAAGIELNYGAAPDVQLTVGIPMAYAHDANGIHSGFGDLEASIKYRFFHDEQRGLQIAVFPGATLPTAASGMGAGKVTGFLPVWAQKDSGPWSIFGGGGYAINPGAGNRDYWSGGVAVTRAVTKNLVFGVEVDRQGADTVGGRASTSLGTGAILQLKSPLRLLISGGPTFPDGGGRADFHLFAALGWDL